MGKGSIKKVCSNTFEHEYWNIGKLVIGIDEAGRGPIAGPEVVAGVVFPIGYHNDDIYDSKAISEKKREELFDVIKKDALEFHIEIVSEKVIDQKNIYQATKDAMTLIANKLNAEVVLTDAMPLERCDKEVIDIFPTQEKEVTDSYGIKRIETHMIPVSIETVFEKLKPVYKQKYLANGRKYEEEFLFLNE